VVVILISQQASKNFMHQKDWQINLKDVNLAETLKKVAMVAEAADSNKKECTM